MSGAQPVVRFAVYLEDAGVVCRAAPRDEVPAVGDRLLVDGREWLVQRRARACGGAVDFELDAVALAPAATPA